MNCFIHCIWIIWALKCCVQTCAFEIKIQLKKKRSLLNGQLSTHCHFKFSQFEMWFSILCAWAVGDNNVAQICRTHSANQQFLLQTRWSSRSIKGTNVRAEAKDESHVLELNCSSPSSSKHPDDSYSKLKQNSEKQILLVRIDANMDV